MARFSFLEPLDPFWTYEGSLNRTDADLLRCCHKEVRLGFSNVSLVLTSDRDFMPGLLSENCDGLSWMNDSVRLAPYPTLNVVRSKPSIHRLPVLADAILLDYSDPFWTAAISKTTDCHEPCVPLRKNASFYFPSFMCHDVPGWDCTEGQQGYDSRIVLSTICAILGGIFVDIRDDADGVGVS